MTNEKSGSIASIRLEGAIDDEVAREAIQTVKSGANLQFSLELGRCHTTRSPFEGVLDANLVGAIASIVSAVLTIWAMRADSQRANKWSKKRVIEVVGTELLKYGVGQFEVTDISGFENLPQGDIEPCHLRLRDSVKNVSYTATLFGDGDTYIVRID